MEKYHKNTGFPQDIHLPKGRIDFTVSDHVKKMSQKREFEIPHSIYLINNDIIEVKLKDGDLWRLLARQNYSKSKDICVVFNTEYKLITAWLIDSDDTHITLDESMYTEPK